MAVLHPQLISHLQQILLILEQTQLQCNVHLIEFVPFYIFNFNIFPLSQFLDLVGISEMMPTFLSLLQPMSVFFVDKALINASQMGERKHRELKNKVGK